MLTDSQRKKIKFNDSPRKDGEDYRSTCLECQKAGVYEMLITSHHFGPGTHNQAKTRHRDKHTWGQYPNPSVTP
jgi:hypothetical protein